jgi:hypothetical protein
LEIIGTRGEVEVVQRLLRQQLRFCEVTLDASAIPFCNFMLRKRHQQARRRPTFFVRALGKL